MQHEKVRPRRLDSTNRVSGEPGAVQGVLERLFGEEWRRMKIVANAFGERAVLKLM